MKKLITAASASALIYANLALPALAINGSASCMGFEASEISPPGSSSEVVGGMPELNQFIQSFGVAPGLAFYSVAGHLHKGSHEDCDEALE